MPRTQLASLRDRLKRKPRETTEDTISGITPPDGAVVQESAPVKAATFAHLMARDDGTRMAGVWAHYLLSGEDVLFRPDYEKEQLYGDSIFRWEELSGRMVWLRGMQNPFAVDVYGQRLIEAGGRTTPEGTRSWEDLVASAQDMLVSYDSRAPLAVLGVRVSETVVAPEDLPLLASTAPIPNEKTHLHDVRRELQAVTDAVRGDGFRGRPLKGSTLRWVIHASRGLGCPVPPVVTDPGSQSDETWQDVAGFTGGAYATASEFSPTVNVRVVRDLVPFERHVVVQSASRFEAREVSSSLASPWLSWLVSLDDPNIGVVDYVMIGEIVPGESLASSARLARKTVESQYDNWVDVGERVPSEVEAALQHGLAVEDEVANQTPEMAARFHGVLLVATSGDTEGQSLDRARKLRSLASRTQKMGLVDPLGAQYALYRAFTPGAPEGALPAVLDGHKTRMPLYYLASAVPNAYLTAGDRTGMPLGPVGGSTEVYIHDPHSLPRNHTSGMVGMLGQQGSGKSTLAGGLIDWSVSSGVQNVVADPAGAFRNMGRLPWLAGDFYDFDLASARQGVAVPSLLVPDPRLADFNGVPGAEFDDASRAARQARVDATVDIFREMLPYQYLVSGEAGVAMLSAIEDVATEYGADYGADPWMLLDRLREKGEYGVKAANLVQVRGGESVFFPPRGKSVDDDEIVNQLNKSILTVISLQGISVPPAGMPRQMWSRDQQRAAPLIHVTSLLAMRAMYRDRGAKQITMDEAGISAAGGQGASPLLLRASTESRKFGATVNIVGQNPSMLTALGDDVSNLIGMVAVGMMDLHTAKACLPLLGIPDGHEHTIASLPQGEFLVRRPSAAAGFDGRRQQTVRRVAIDIGWWHPELRRVLDTTPAGAGFDDSFDDGLTL